MTSHRSDVGKEGPPSASCSWRSHPCCSQQAAAARRTARPRPSSRPATSPRRPGQLVDQRRLDDEPALLAADADQHVERRAAEGRLDARTSTSRASPPSTPARASRSCTTACMYVTTGNDDIFALSTVKTGKHPAGSTSSNITPEDHDGLLRLAQPRRRRSATAASTSASSTARSSRSTRRRARWSGRSSSCSGRRATRSPARRSTWTARSTSASSAREYGIARLPAAARRQDGQAACWRFYTIPGPNDPGGDTWPQGHRRVPARRRLGLVDARGRPEPRPAVLLDRQRRQRLVRRRPRRATTCSPASIVALDVKTGKLKWHFQEVHHDIWDYDAPSPAVLFDAEVDGKTVQGIGAAGQDRLAVPARPRDRQAALRHRREAGAAERRPEDGGRRSRSRATARSSRTARCRRRTSRASRRSARARPRSAPIVSRSTIFTPSGTKDC